MPAIQPARLRHQAALLVEHFDSPPAFVRSLHHLLDFYADRAHRPGLSGTPLPLIDAYRVRPPVLRMLQQEMVPRAQADPEAGLALCDALWEEAYLEFRLLAIHVLGQLPPEPPEPVTGRLKAWSQSKMGDQLVTNLLDQGAERLRRENPQAVLEMAEAWLADSNLFQQRLALRILLPLIQDERFQNLPVFFRLIQPLARVVPASLRPDLLDLLIALAHRSPQETAYFLRQSLTMSNNPDTPWLIRQSAAEFPPELQESLRAAVRGLDRP